MNKFNLVAYILQIAGGLVLAGLAVYYFAIKNWVNGSIFLAIGAVFVIMPVRSILKARKQKREEEEKRESANRRGFL